MTPTAGRRRFDLIGAGLAIAALAFLAWRGLGVEGPSAKHPTAGPSPAAAARVNQLLRDAAAQVESGNSEQAAASLNQAIELDPNNAGAWLRLGQLRLQLGRAEESLVCFEHAARLDPHNYAPHHGLSVAYRSLGRHEEAAEAKKAYETRQMMHGTPGGGMGAPTPPAP